MEYGRLVVLGYSSYRVDTVPRSSGGSLENAPASFGLSDTAGDESGASRSSPPVSRKQSMGQLWKPLGDQNAQFVLEKRPRANGVQLCRFHHVAPIGGANTWSPDASNGSSKDLKGITTRIMQRIEKERSQSTVDNQRGEREEGAEAPSPPVAPYLMCVPMNDKDAMASVTEFHADPSADLFQIGRMPCRQNDFVVPGPRVGASGTVSRYAARILCMREPPFACRLFAGGFDAARRMSTAGHALKHCAYCGAWLKLVLKDHTCVTQTLLEQSGGDTRDRSHLSRKRRNSSRRLNGGSVTHNIDVTHEDGVLQHLELPVHHASELPMDGLTKNGVRLWLPERKQWFEVSVNGNLYAIEAQAAATNSDVAASRFSASLPSSTFSSRSSRRRHHEGRNSAFNRPSAGAEDLAPVLTDGAIIDLGGVQLQFQTSYRPEAGVQDVVDSSELLEAPVVYGRATLSSVGMQLERLNVQCPVQLHPLRFTRAAPGEEVPLDQIPHVFPACGHVFGYEKRIASSHTCPLCRTPGSLVQLLLKENSQLQSAEEQHAIPECVLNPCGHAISSKLARHYAALLMPNGRAICPFCAVHLDPRVPYSRLFLYSDADD
ncbi:hypothetical protein BBJ28_00003387 [Nothophytophthora sp. Chile5]|nr:hypothetical protein BBJ28_00003387 [Nothophytophthora sp. Chile5]